MKWQHLALLLLLVSAAALPSKAEDEAEIDDDEDEDDDDIEKAFLLVRRVVADERPLEGKQTTITITVYNAGKATATDVWVDDRPWPQAYTVVGNISAKFDSLPAGSSIQHSYKVASGKAGMYEVPSTFVSYIPAEDEPRQSVTSPILAFRTFTFGESLAARALEFGATVTGGNFTTGQDWRRLAYGLILLGVAIFGYRSYNTVTETNRSRRRARALADLGASEKDK